MRWLRLVLWGLLLVPARGEANALVRYTVLRGETCTTIARKLFGDGKRVELLHANNALGPPPHHLTAGQILQVPATADEPDARLTAVRNQVDTYTPTKASGHANDTLQRGHRVSTLESSSAALTLKNGAELQLGEHALIMILGSGAESARDDTSQTSLLNGSLRARLAELSGKASQARMNIATPGASVAAGAGETQVQVDAKKTTRLAVYRGRAKLHASGAAIAVPEGYGSKAELGKKPTPPGD